jgi:hypothetical protein
MSMSAFITMDPPSQLEEAQEWYLHPHFASPTLLSEPLPQAMDEEDKDRWAVIARQDNDDIRFIATSGQNVSLQSIHASNRYCKWVKLRDKFLDHVPFLLLMAECHFLMNDVFGAFFLAQQAQDSVERANRQDNALHHTVRMLEILAEDGMDDHEPDDPNLHVCRYTRPPDWVSSSTPSDLTELQLKWVELQQKSDGAEQFARYACVSLPAYWRLESELARCGLHANVIEGIANCSRRNNPTKIIAIFKNTQRCYDSLKSIMKGEMKADASFLKEMHRQLLEDDNIEIEMDQVYHIYVATLIPMGTYRGVPSYASHAESGGYETQFCPPRHLDEEMDWFYKEVEAILSDTDLDPYRACAWIQHSFLRIHPFADENDALDG